jgi:hypothetical protein
MTRPIDRAKRLRDRRTDKDSGQALLKSASLRTSLLVEGAVNKDDYIAEAMEPVPPEYTAKTFDESERIQNQLSKEFGLRELSIEYQHQGSVTNDTHIRFYSDIDLLVIPKWFWTVLRPLVPKNPYDGDPLQELIDLLMICEDKLGRAFPEATVDSAKPSALGISEGSLDRKVDVVPANWLNTQRFVETGHLFYRGIQVLDFPNRRRLTNYPFKHNWRLDKRDDQTAGRLRRLIRFVKSVRADADSPIDVSSYDICGLCYSMEVETLAAASSDLYLCVLWCQYALSLLNSAEKRAKILVPNETRYLFDEASGLSVAALRALTIEVADVLGISGR